MSDLVERLRKPLDGGDYSILTEAASEIERLRKGIRAYLDGNYDHPRAHRHGPTKGCKHGRFYYEDCCECDADYFSVLLGEENRLNQQHPK